MLILPPREQVNQHNQAKEGITRHFNEEMEKILSENSEKDKYWILGKVRFPDELGGAIGRCFLQACVDKPPLVTNSFLYEVDNRRGVKELLWIMNPDGSLRIPRLNKTIQVHKKKQKGRKK